MYLIVIPEHKFTCLKLLCEWYHYLYITVPETPPLTRNFTVDVFTTFCAGEPYDMILETLKAVKAITYPHETHLFCRTQLPFYVLFDCGKPSAAVSALEGKSSLAGCLMGRVKFVKGISWMLRRQLYTGLRNTAMLVMLLLQVGLENIYFGLTSYGVSIIN